MDMLLPNNKESVSETELPKVVFKISKIMFPSSEYELIEGFSWSRRKVLGHT